MRKTVLLLLLVILIPCTLSALSFGYGVSLEGWSGFNESSAARLSFLLDLTDSRHVTLEGGAALGISSGCMIFSGLNADLSVRTFSVTHHPFSFMFANTVIWSPGLSFGIIADDSFDYAWRFGLSLLDFIDVHFRYEFLKAYVTFNRSFSYAGWAVDLFRVSYYF